MKVSRDRVTPEFSLQRAGGISILRHVVFQSGPDSNYTYMYEAYRS